MFKSVEALVEIFATLGMVGLVFFSIKLVIGIIKKEDNYKKNRNYLLISFGLLMIAFIASEINVKTDSMRSSNIPSEKEVASISYDDMRADSISTLHKKGSFSGTVKNIKFVEAPNDDRSITFLLIWLENNQSQPLYASLTYKEQSVSIGDYITVHGSYIGNRNVEYNGYKILDVPAINIESIE